jgi:hypothetical protein
MMGLFGDDGQNPYVFEGTLTCVVKLVVLEVLEVLVVLVVLVVQEGSLPRQLYVGACPRMFF